MIKKYSTKIIPAVLVATIMVAVVFGFSYVEEASTVHVSIQDGVTSFLTDTATLPAIGTDVACTISSPDDILIIGLYADTTPTTEASPGLRVDSMFIHGTEFHEGSASFFMTNDEEIVDVFADLAADSFGPGLVNIPMNGGEQVIFTFNNNGNDETIVDLTFVIRCSSGNTQLNCVEVEL